MVKYIGKEPQLTFLNEGYICTLTGNTRKKHALISQSVLEQR